YHALEARNRGVSQQIILYDKAERKTDRIRNPNWFVEEGDGFYKQIAEQITAGLTDPYEKLLAIGKWLQTNLHYIEEASEINKLTLATFMDNGGDCEDSYSAFKTLANAIGLGNYVGGVVFKDHVAATIQGNHGQTTYAINGEVWTIFETATDGHALEAGKTSHKNPLTYILHDGKIIPASADIVPLNIVPISEINSGLIDNFNQTIENLKKFIEDPVKQPSEEALDKNENILEESETLIKAIMDAYTAIASSGKTADILADQLNSIIKKYKEFLQKWESFMSKQIGDAKKLELKDEPEKIQESAKRFDDANKHFTQNLIRTNGKLIELLKAYQGKEKDKAASSATHDAMIDVINASGVSLDVDHMEIEYEETLQHADPKIAAEAKKIMEDRMSIINKYIYGPLNAVRKILRAHSGE
ncbi:MAG: transglutaminase domain-containing protein, partial [Patescibacteria group bacterium]